MSVAFPNIQPSSRRFVPPRWANTSSRSQSGVTTKRLWGNKPSEAQLSLSFNNVRDTVADQILSSYDAARGSISSLTLPSLVFEGITGSLNARLQSALTQSGLLWFFKDDDPPEVESVAPGICNVRVNLVAELRMD